MGVAIASAGDWVVFLVKGRTAVQEKTSHSHSASNGSAETSLAECGVADRETL